MNSCTSLLVLVTNFTNSYAGFTNPSEFSSVISPDRFIVDTCLGSWESSVFIRWDRVLMVGTLVWDASVPLNSSQKSAQANLARLLNAPSGYVNGLFSKTFFRGLPCSLGSFIGSRRGFFKGGIGYSISNCDLLLDLLRTGSLAIRTWWVRRAHTLTCLVVSEYLMKILFYVFRISNFDRFSAKIWVLILLPKMQMCSTFCQIVFQASLGTMTDLSTCMVGKWFYR